MIMIMMSMIRKIYAVFLCLEKLIRLLLKDIYGWLMPKKYKNITDDIILITGGGRGIGKELALEFMKYHPKHIILCGRTETSLAQTAKEVQEQGVNCAYMVCDVRSREIVNSVVEEVTAKFGQVSILINNAGIVHADSILESNPDDIVSQVSTNTLSNFWTVKAVLPSMLKSNHGHIVAIDSMLGWAGLNSAAFYSASKFATSAFMDSLSDELQMMDKNGIHTTIVYPYHVDNEMFAGITSRFPLLFRPVNEKYLAFKIVDAVLTNRTKIIVPKLMYAVAWFYSIAPVRAITEIMKFLRVDQAMVQMKEAQQKTHTKQPR